MSEKDECEQDAGYHEHIKLYLQAAMKSKLSPFCGPQEFRGEMLRKMSKSLMKKKLLNI